MASTILPRTSDKVLDTGMHYKVRNNTEGRLTTGDGKTDLLRWNKIAYRCEAGEEVVVPWPVIACYFGDPRSQHNKIVKAEDSQGEHTVPSRGSELLRLSVFYGTYEHNIDVLASVIPDVTIFTLDDVEIVPPCFDPDGEYVYGYQRSMQRSDDISVMLSELREHEAILEERLARLEGRGGSNEDALEEDAPHTI